MRKIVMLVTKVIPGASTVEFEKVVGRIDAKALKKLFLEEVRIGVFIINDGLD